MALTAAGRTFLARAERILDLAAALDRDLDDHAAGAAGEARLAAVAAAVSGRLADDLAAFERAEPRIHIVLSEGSNRAAVAAVENATADIGVVVDHQLPAGLERRAYAEDPVWVIAPDGHLLFEGVAPGAGVRFERVLDFDLISLKGGASIESLVASAATVIERPVRKHFEVERYDSLRRLVEAGFGVGFIRRSGIERYLGALRLDARPLDEPWAARRVVAVRREERAANRAADALFDHLARAGALPDAATGDARPRPRAGRA
jgi:DNA-binding transcriptional LysR family regulator